MGGLAGGLNFGRNNNAGTQATGVNQTASMRISDIRSNYNYPNWFDTTMGYYRDGKISSEAFESAYANLTKQGLITLKTGGTPATAGYNRPTFAHDSDKYGFDYLYGQRDFQSDEDIWKKGISPLHDKHTEQQDYIDQKIKEVYASRRSKKQVEQILIDYYGDDIKRLDAGHAKQETSISGKSGIGHTHAGGGEEEEDCGWFGEKCWFKPPDWDLGWLKWLGLAIGAGLLLWLIRPLFKIGANLTK